MGSTATCWAKTVSIPARTASPPVFRAPCRPRRDPTVPPACRPSVLPTEQIGQEVSEDRWAGVPDRCVRAVVADGDRRDSRSSR